MMRARFALCSWLFAAVAMATPLHAQISSQIPDGGGNTIQPSPITPPSDGDTTQPGPISPGGGGDQILPSPTPVSGGTPPVTTLASQTWTGASGGDWNTAGNWSGGAKP